MKNQRQSSTLFLILTVVVGLIAVTPQIIYQPYLLQGDHGRDMYIAQRVFQGDIPYRDFCTDNGPLMPFYYATFLQYFGNNIRSILIGYAIMIFLAGLLIFLIARKGISPAYAFLAALWYWTWRGQEFFYTFNHIGAVVTGLATLLFTIISIKHQRKRYFLFAFLSSIICMSIRPDIGLAALAGLLLASFIYQQKDYLPQRSFFVITITFFAGMFVMINLFVPEIFAPYWAAIHWNLIISNLYEFFHYNILFMSQNIFIGGLSILLGLIFLDGIVNLWRTRNAPASQTAIRHLVCFLIFFILFFMEYLLGFRFFRWVWVLTFLFLILFYGIYFSVIRLGRLAASTVYFFLLLCCGLMIGLNYVSIAQSKNEGCLLNVNGSRLYMATDQKPWIQTVEQTSQFILDNTKPGESILTMPYDTLYCFLTHRKQATPNTSLIGIPGTYVIPKLEKQKVRLIVISNRAFRLGEKKLFGVLGKDYGADLWEYIQNNYTLAAQIGPWEKVATPIENHATRIYLRSTPFQKSSKNHPKIGEDL